MLPMSSSIVILLPANQFAEIICASRIYSLESIGSASMPIRESRLETVDFKNEASVSLSSITSGGGTSIEAMILMLTPALLPGV